MAEREQEVDKWRTYQLLLLLHPGWHLGHLPADGSEVWKVRQLVPIVDRERLGGVKSAGSKKHLAHGGGREKRLLPHHKEQPFVGLSGDSAIFELLSHTRQTFLSTSIPPERVKELVRPHTKLTKVTLSSSSEGQSPSPFVRRLNH